MKYMFLCSTFLIVLSNLASANPYRSGSCEVFFEEDMNSRWRAYTALMSIKHGYDPSDFVYKTICDTYPGKFMRVDYVNSGDIKTNLHVFGGNGCQGNLDMTLVGDSFNISKTIGCDKDNAGKKGVSKVDLLGNSGTVYAVFCNGGGGGSVETKAGNNCSSGNGHNVMCDNSMSLNDHAARICR